MWYRMTGVVGVSDTDLELCEKMGVGVSENSLCLNNHPIHILKLENSMKQ